MTCVGNPLDGEFNRNLFLSMPLNFLTIPIMIGVTFLPRLEYLINGIRQVTGVMFRMWATYRLAYLALPSIPLRHF